MSHTRNVFAFGGDRLAVAGDQIGGGVEIFERDHFGRRVHVAVRDRNERGRHAAAADLDHVGVGSGRPPLGGDLNRNSAGAGDRAQLVKEARVQVRTFRQDRAGAQEEVAVLLFVEGAFILAQGAFDAARDRGGTDPRADPL